MYANVTFNFQGKRALVTGAARGIGHDIALKLAGAGAETFALDINKEGLDILKSKNPSIQTVCVDLSDWEAARKAVQALTPIDLLVNDAAIVLQDSVLDANSESFDAPMCGDFRIFSVNAKAPLNLSQIVAQDLIARKRPGSIVNMSSLLSKLPFVNGLMSYTISKAAINSITKSMARELGQYQIRVNSVLPTLVKTELSKETWTDKEKTKWHLDLIPLARFAEVEDISGPVLFLLSDAACMVTGHLMLVDGGQNVH